VEDTTPPTINVPADITIECTEDESSANTGVATGADTCGTVTVTESDVETAACGNTKTIVRTWTVTDECGNSVSADQTITVEDTTPPTINVPADITIECTEDESSANTGVATGSDTCGTVTVTESDVETAACGNTKTIVRTWTVTDECGNSVSADQTITVEDTTPPTFNESLPADIDVECDAVPDAETLTAFDTCDDATVTFEEEITGGTCVGDYIIERTWTATDACGNETEHTQIITVMDTTAPTLVTQIDDITVACNDIPDVPDLVIEDACSNNISVDFTEDSTQVNDFEDYEIIRTWTVTDDCGNTTDFTQTIFVEISNVIEAVDAQRCILDIEFDLFDLLSGDFDIDGTWSVVSGNATLNGSLFDPSTVIIGDYIFKYAITEGPCPTEVEVTVAVDDECTVLPCSNRDNLIISKTVTANGDDENDFFTITGLEFCGFTIELQIFNRWGAKVYENNNYQSGQWGGEAHGSSVGSSGKVPTGTYYYIINLRNSGLKPFAGPIYVATDK
uniref:gliding motility-associated C-terminal domain-containing protein n=1 Tax=Winogradskyella sp. TaxID=1883156 RepID=UPI0026268070